MKVSNAIIAKAIKKKPSPFPAFYGKRKHKVILPRGSANRDKLFVMKKMMQDVSQVIEAKKEAAEAAAMIVEGIPLGLDSKPIMKKGDMNGNGHGGKAPIIVIKGQPEEHGIEGHGNKAVQDVLEVAGIINLDTMKKQAQYCPPLSKRQTTRLCGKEAYDQLCFDDAKMVPFVKQSHLFIRLMGLTGQILPANVDVRSNVICLGDLYADAGSVMTTTLDMKQQSNYTFTNLALNLAHLMIYRDAPTRRQQNHLMDGAFYQVKKEFMEMPEEISQKDTIKLEFVQGGITNRIDMEIQLKIGLAWVNIDENREYTTQELNNNDYGPELMPYYNISMWRTSSIPTGQLRDPATGFLLEHSPRLTATDTLMILMRLYVGKDMGQIIPAFKQALKQRNAFTDIVPCLKWMMCSNFGKLMQIYDRSELSIETLMRKYPLDMLKALAEIKADNMNMRHFLSPAIDSHYAGTARFFWHKAKLIDPIDREGRPLADEVTSLGHPQDFDGVRCPWDEEDQISQTYIRPTQAEVPKFEYLLENTTDTPPGHVATSTTDNKMYVYNNSIPQGAEVHMQAPDEDHNIVTSVCLLQGTLPALRY